MTGTLDSLLEGRHLSVDEAAAVLDDLARGAVPDVVAGAVLAALRAKGETADEIHGFAHAMRRLARRPRLPALARFVDVVGTGGDGSASLNLSTGAALLAAACGVAVVKHGNRAVSSRAGSADVLEALGLALPLDEAEAGRCLAETGFTFLFAPYYHPAMATLARVRRSLGVRTLFNVLGPLANPAEPPFLLVGAYSLPVARLLAETLSRSSARRAFVVHGALGWDEPTPVGPFTRLDVGPGRVEQREVDPRAYGVPRCAPEALRGGDADANAATLARALGGEPGPARDALVLGAALVLELVGDAGAPREAASRAAAAIDDGRAAALLDRLSRFSSGRRAADA